MSGKHMQRSDQSRYIDERIPSIQQEFTPSYTPANPRDNQYVYSQQQVYTTNASYAAPRNGRPQSGIPTSYPQNTQAYSRNSAARAQAGAYSRSRNQSTAQHQQQQKKQPQKKQPQKKRRNSRARRKHSKALSIPFIIILFLLAFYGTSGLICQGKIFYGVKVANIPLGGLTLEEASNTLANELADISVDVTVDIYGDEASQSAGVALGGADSESFNRDVYKAWTTTASDLGAHIDSASLAQSAYQVGRGWDIFLGRFLALIGLRNQSGVFTYTQSSLSALSDAITAELGQPMVNSDIALSGSQFVVVSGHDGYVVDSDAFKQSLDTAFLSQDSRPSFVVEMTTAEIEVDDEQAQSAADFCNQSITSDLEAIYEDKNWTLHREDLASFISTRVDGEGKKAQIEVYTDSEKLQAYIESTFLKDQTVGYAAQDADFFVYNNTLTVIPSVDGMGMDYDSAATQIDEVYDSQEQQTEPITFALAAVEPALTTEDAQAMNLDTCYSTFSIGYNVWNTNNVVNIRLLAAALDGSIVSPGEVFSINETAGECNASKGYMEAAAYSEGKQIMDVGGGICQVATTLFNAVYQAGYPIVERTNHMFYVSKYPDGLDATISWPYVDFKFQNDTENYLYISFDAYTNDSVTCTLWGVDPKRSVESVNEGDYKITAHDLEEIVVDSIDQSLISELSVDGVDGHCVNVTRTVYDEKGHVLSETTFFSEYSPKTQVDVVTEPSGSASAVYYRKSDGTLISYSDYQAEKAKETEASETSDATSAEAT